MKFDDKFWYNNGYWKLENNDKLGRYPCTTTTTPKWRKMIDVLFEKCKTKNNDGTITHRCITEKDIEEYLDATSTIRRTEKST